jgi:hypothetical protein
MLKRIVVGGLLLGGVAVIAQLVLGTITSSQPLWDGSLVVIMTLTGMVGGFFDERRDRRRRVDK